MNLEALIGKDMINKTEIGSEFWSGCTPLSHSEYTLRAESIYNTHLHKVVETLSGRTALEHIVELLYGQGKRSVYLPAYCCHTMIEPFLSHNMKVFFYDITWTGKELHRLVDFSIKADVIMLLDYFGHTDSETNVIAQQAKEAGMTIIYDATHSMYSHINTDPYDFVYGSYRKWVDINCGFVAWNEEFSKGEITQNENKHYATTRSRLFDLKADYMNGGHTMKEEFLPLIETAETILENDYHHKMPDARSLEILRTTDADYIKNRRRSNAKLLTETVNELNDDRVKCLNPILNPLDIPLFVPVIVSPEQRNSLRRYLIENQIYCPVHWPLSELHVPGAGSKHLFDSELSLICDQRYNEKDMMRIADSIEQYLKKN